MKRERKKAIKTKQQTSHTQSTNLTKDSIKSKRRVNKLVFFADT